MTRYRWVAARKAEGFPITMSCAVADVSRQAFHDWRARSSAGPTIRELAEAELVALMHEIHAEFDATYGEPRMTEELAHRGRVVNPARSPRSTRAWRTQFPNVPSPTPRLRATSTTVRPSSITNATASRLNSSVNERRDLTGSCSITDMVTSYWR